MKLEMITFKIDSKLYNLALEWIIIERDIMPESLKDVPEQERPVILEKINKEWKKWIRKHNLVIKEKPVKFMGMKVSQSKIKHYDKLKDVFELLRIFTRYEFGVITKK